MTKLGADGSPAAVALEFIMLTATRRSEVLGIPGVAGLAGAWAVSTDAHGVNTSFAQLPYWQLP